MYEACDARVSLEFSALNRNRLFIAENSTETLASQARVYEANRVKLKIVRENAKKKKISRSHRLYS